MDIYYDRLQEVDIQLEAIAAERDRKIKRLLKKYDKVLAEAAEKTEKVLAKLGETIPAEVKINKETSI